MNGEHEHEHEHDELIELGVASLQTMGASVGMDDHEAGLFLWAGLSSE